MKHKKTDRTRYSNFTSLGLAVSEPGPVSSLF